MISISGFNPQVNYYVHDGTSLNLSYTGIKTYVSTHLEYSHYYYNAEIGLSDILAKQKRLNFSFDVDYFFGEYRPYSDLNNWWKKQPGSMMYIGAAINWKLRNLPCLAVHMDYRQYFNLNKGSGEYHKPFITLSFGLTYFFSFSKKRRKTSDPFE